MGIFDLFTGGATREESSRLHTEQRQIANTLALFQERIAELELALDDAGWIRLGGHEGRSFSREALNKIARTARVMYLWNPLIRRAVNLRGYYTWAQGVDISVQDEAANAIIQEHINNPDNSEDLYGDNARMETDEELHSSGNVFSVLFTAPSGRVNIRSIPAEQVTRIVRNPDDIRDVWYYERRWVDGESGREHVRMYPDVLYRPVKLPGTFEGKQVEWNAPIAHLKAGGQKFSAFGVPETYPALDWVRAHKDFLEDWSSLTKALTRFAWQITAEDPAAAAADFASTFGGDAFGETNPPPTAGSVFFADEGASISAIPKVGATPTVQDARELRLMVAAAMDLPDTFLSGDVDVGNHATSRSLDRPTEMMIRSRQSRWADYLRRILNYVLAAHVRARKLPGAIEQEGGREHVRLAPEMAVSVAFPDILERDRSARIAALTQAATLGGYQSAGLIPDDVLLRELLTELGIQNIDAIMASFEADGPAEESLARAVGRLREALVAAN